MKEYTKRLILLIVICLFTLILLFVTIKLHEKRNNEILSISNLDGYLTEIKYMDLETHIIEQPNAIVYISNSGDDVSRKFEDILKEVIIKHNLENEITYININNSEITDPVYRHSPSLVFYNKGQIEDIIDCSSLNSIKHIIKIFEERGVVID